MCLEEWKEPCPVATKSVKEDRSLDTIQRAWNAGCGLSIYQYYNLWLSSRCGSDPDREGEGKALSKLHFSL